MAEPRIPSPPSRAERENTNKRRAYLKIAAIGAVLGVILGALIAFVDHETLNGLRHHLTLFLIVAIVVIVNLTSFLLFILFFAIYQWIRRDFEPSTDE